MRPDELSEFLQLLRGGKRDEPVDEIVRTWRHAGIGTSQELARWLAAGVFDGYRAGLLKAIGIAPEDLDDLEAHDGLPVGYAFAIGKLGVHDVQERVANARPRRENTG